jgi:predicted Zn-dependent protease with MMP-like domain
MGHSSVGPALPQRRALVQFGARAALVMALRSAYISQMTLFSPDHPAPDAAMIEALARDAVLALPEPWREAATAVALRVEEFPPDDVMDAMGIEDAYDLTGMYDGIPLTEKSVMDQPGAPDVIWLFRRPILDEWVDRGNVGLGELVTHVMVHELAHHFGWSDQDIAAIDPWWE